MQQSNGSSADPISSVVLKAPIASSYANNPQSSPYTVQNRSTNRKSTRPSTAPPVQEIALLPSGDYTPLSSRGLYDELDDLATPPDLKSNGQDGIYMISGGLEDGDGSSSTLALDSLPNDSPATLAGDRTAYNLKSSDVDWATFIANYAAGRWDPHVAPNPPIPYHVIAGHSQVQAATSSRTRVAADSPSKDLETTEDSAIKKSAIDTTTAKQKSEKSPIPPTLDPALVFPSSGLAKPRFGAPLHLPLPSHRLRNSFSSVLSQSPQPSSIHNVDVHASVATMRWAASRVDISPLALPSPEAELTDPMRGVMAAIPGAHSTQKDDKPPTPGGVRKSRLSGFWEGTTNIDNDGTTHSAGPTQLTPIEGSPSEPELRPVDLAMQTRPSGSASLPAATAPLLRGQSDMEGATTDYFGIASYPPDPGENELHPDRTESLPPIIIDRAESPSSGFAVLTEPVFPRRATLLRQSSSPLPVTTPGPTEITKILGGRLLLDNNTAFKHRKAIKEEQKFKEQKYLSPPYPPDELERRRALHKFNIWHTNPDVNFDRIAHLTKLVFNTKGVCLSLVDSTEQWFKAELGLGAQSCERSESICGHTILQRGDEPMVLLDTYRDWRFANNNFVVGGPLVRFYAGAPLRTSDGYNIGTLCVIDPEPREEFSPRERHTLKEFAAIAMREMELWREKIQMRIRERIQTSMERFSRECLEIDGDVQDHDHPDPGTGTSMDRVYDRAAKLVKRTLDVEGVIVMDVSHCEVLESMGEESSVSVTMHHGDAGMEMTKRQLSTEEYHNLNLFFERYPDGRISEGIIPQSFKPFLPTHVQYALTVPIFNIDKRPFALLCAYNATDTSKRFLEGHELSYLRAIGVIILSAVLKRRMLLADKAKALFISNISHELRTPLHGILAAAELLSDTSLNHSQASFLQTVQACGTSLVETVNHVLDFTKLSGNSKAGGVENVIVPTPVDLMQLVEEAVDGCWIGHRARTAITGDSGIGSVYSPPTEEQGSPVATRNRKYVETVIDVGHRPEGWNLKVEKGGIRRVLMNLFGNSLKFTSDGYVHVVLRQVPWTEEDHSPEKIRVELSVYDTGKGISQNFLKNQLFHPFSQENPLQTGTGLGLAIVNSIVTSENVGGKVDVWSEEGAGTEIKVTFPAEVPEDFQKAQPIDMGPMRVDDCEPLPTVSLLGFTASHAGIELLNKTVRTYLSTWWGFQIVDGDGDIIIINEDPAPVVEATERRDISRPFILLSTGRGNPAIMAIASEHELIGGFCRILYKPGGPSRLRTVLNLSVHALAIGRTSRGASPDGPTMDEALHGLDEIAVVRTSPLGTSMPRRNSEEAHSRRVYSKRPPMTPRASTAHPIPGEWIIPDSGPPVDVPDPDTPVPTIAVGNGGSLLTSSVGSLDAEHHFRVLIVEDNSILRNLLTKWLSNKGYDFRAAVDGRDGVNVFAEEGPFDIILLDLSMPVLDGVGATLEIRRIEAKRKQPPNTSRARIVALTGMSSLEDKRRAFDAGVDGYLVKPVAFKTLDEIFHKLGVA